MKTQLFILLQYCLPQHVFSRLIGKLASWHAPGWLKNLFLRWFIKKHGIDLCDAEKIHIDDYPTFNAFFTRRLQVALRPIDTADVITSPADGIISQIGSIDGTTILQAKNFDYALAPLLVNDTKLTNTFTNGTFVTIYLSPADCHRVHMPLSGKLIRSIYVPGKLFSVNPATVHKIPGLFTRNERLIHVFASEIGTVVVIMIGAMLVAGMHTVWKGTSTPNQFKKVRHWDYRDKNISLSKGEELGYFNFGSTVITLLPTQTIPWLATLQSGTAVKFGQALSEPRRKSHN